EVLERVRKYFVVIDREAAQSA
ncbi:cupin, partial [Cupriavidus pinatubonensis]